MGPGTLQGQTAALKHEQCAAEGTQELNLVYLRSVCPSHPDVQPLLLPVIFATLVRCMLQFLYEEVRRTSSLATETLPEFNVPGTALLLRNGCTMRLCLQSAIRKQGNVHMRCASTDKEGTSMTAAQPSACQSQHAHCPGLPADPSFCFATNSITSVLHVAQNFSMQGRMMHDLEKK